MAKKQEGSGIDAGVRIILEKHLVKRSEIDESLKRVLLTLYKGETHTAQEWDVLIKSRLERQAI